MSALPPEADMLIVGINVCYVPEADIRMAVNETSLAGPPPSQEAGQPRRGQRPTPL